MTGFTIETANIPPIRTYKSLFILCLLLGPLGCLLTHAQEFPSGVTGYLEAHQGVNTTLKGTPDLFVGGLQFRPQFTVIGSLLRLGGTVGVIYTDAHADGLFGASAAIKATTFTVSPFGSIANVQLQADYFRSTRNHSYLGGGPRIEIGQLLMIGLTAHRDLQANAWLFQTTLGYNLFRKKRTGPKDPFSH